jgi:hypothetical protein
VEGSEVSELPAQHHFGDLIADPTISRAWMLCCAILTVHVVLLFVSGATLAHYIASTSAYRVVLFDKKEYFEYTPSMLRVLVEPEHADTCHLKYNEMELLTQRKNVEIIVDEVTELTDEAVKTQSGKVVKYDKLVLAMGSNYWGTQQFACSGQEAAFHTDFISLSSVSSFSSRSHQAGRAQCEFVESFASDSLRAQQDRSRHKNHDLWSRSSGSRIRS